MVPLTLTENQGQIPLFYSERVALTSADGATTKFPFYLRKEDLDRDFAQLAAAGELQVNICICILHIYIYTYIYIYIWHATRDGSPRLGRGKG